MVRDGMENFHVPGVAVGIWGQGKEELQGWGKTNLDHPLDVTPDTLFLTLTPNSHGDSGHMEVLHAVTNH